MKMGVDENGNIVRSNLLLKIQKITHLKQLQQGKLYMKRLDFHRKNEREGAGDADEGLVAYYPTATLTIDGVEIADAKDVRLHAFGDHPVFCCFSVELEKQNEHEHLCCVNKKLLSEFADSSGEYGMMLIQRTAFRQRISDTLEKQNMMGWFDDVTYTDDMERYSKEDLYKVAFRKKTKFNHQHECRLLVNASVDDYYILDIGDLSDISMILPITNVEKDVKVGVQIN
ncbi:MAG: hypothetical protein ACI4TK_18925 [Agathobacter sp.]